MAGRKWKKCIKIDLYLSERKTKELTEKELYNKLKEEDKITMNHNYKSNSINSGFPLGFENRKKYQEGVDYRTEEMGGGFRKHIILSEKLKADFQRFNGGQEWTKIEKEVKNFSSVSKNNEHSKDNSSNYNSLIIVSIVGLIIIAIGLLIIKKRQKKHGPKR